MPGWAQGSELPELIPETLRKPSVHRGHPCVITAQIIEQKFLFLPWLYIKSWPSIKGTIWLRETGRCGGASHLCPWRHGPEHKKLTEKLERCVNPSLLRTITIWPPTSGSRRRRCVLCLDCRSGGAGHGESQLRSLPWGRERGIQFPSPSLEKSEVHPHLRSSGVMSTHHCSPQVRP